VLRGKRSAQFGPISTPLMVQRLKLQCFAFSVFVELSMRIRVTFAGFSVKSNNSEGGFYGSRMVDRLILGGTFRYQNIPFRVRACLINCLMYSQYFPA